MTQGRGHVVIEMGNFFFKTPSQFLHILALGLAVIGAGIGQRVKANLFADGNDFRFPVKKQGPDDGHAAAGKMGHGQEGLVLPRLEEIQHQGFHGVIIVMGQGNLAAAKFAGFAVHRGPAEVGTGKARGVAPMAPEGLDIDLLRIMGESVGVAEVFQFFLGKSSANMPSMV